MTERMDFADGKYTVINENGKLTALRHGELWGRDLTGDNLIYWMLMDALKLKAERDALAAKLAELEGQTDNLLSACHRLALELECLLLDTKDSASVSRWWDSAMAALDEWHKVKDSVSAEQPWSPTRLATWCACNDPAKQRQPPTREG